MITYKKAGVDIDKANMFVDWLRKKYPKIGFFSGFYPIDKQKVIVATTDGVGTKIKIAQYLCKNDTVGIDLVAMNVNDIITCGAKPLFFLDYIACGKVELKLLKDLANGIIKGCEISNCELLGGETAEMPGMYKPNEYDLAGFACGIVEKDKIISGKEVQVNDKIIGLPSSGIHSNGYSLIRKIFSDKDIKKYANELLIPTRIYVSEITRILKKFKPNKEIKAIVNITGGGFYDNIIRVLPKNCCAIIDKNKWTPNNIFKLIKEKSNTTDKEMYRTFNMGIGMVIITASNITQKIIKILKDAIIIGEIQKSTKQEVKILGIDI